MDEKENKKIELEKEIKKESLKKKFYEMKYKKLKKSLIHMNQVKKEMIDYCYHINQKRIDNYLYGPKELIPLDSSQFENYDSKDFSSNFLLYLNELSTYNPKNMLNDVAYFIREHERIQKEYLAAKKTYETKIHEIKNLEKRKANLSRLEKKYEPSKLMEEKGKLIARDYDAGIRNCKELAHYYHTGTNQVSKLLKKYSVRYNQQNNKDDIIPKDTILGFHYEDNKMTIYYQEGTKEKECSKGEYKEYSKTLKKEAFNQVYRLVKANVYTNVNEHEKERFYRWKKDLIPYMDKTREAGLEDYFLNLIDLNKINFLEREEYGKYLCSFKNVVTKKVQKELTLKKGN